MNHMEYTTETEVTWVTRIQLLIPDSPGSGTLMIFTVPVHVWLKEKLKFLFRFRLGSHKN